MFLLCYPLLFYCNDSNAVKEIPESYCQDFCSIFRYVVMYTISSDEDTVPCSDFAIPKSLSFLSLLFSHLQQNQLSLLIQNGMLLLSHFPSSLILPIQLVASLSSLSSLASSATKWIQSQLPIYATESAIPPDQRDAYASLLRSLNSFCMTSQDSSTPFSVRTSAVELLSRLLVPSSMEAELAWVTNQFDQVTTTLDDVSWLRFYTSVFQLLYSFLRSVAIASLRPQASTLYSRLWRVIDALRLAQHDSANQRVIALCQTIVQLSVSSLSTLLHRAASHVAVVCEDVESVVRVMIEEEEEKGLAAWQFRKQETLQVEYYHCFMALAECFPGMTTTEQERVLVGVTEGCSL